MAILIEQALAALSPDDLRNFMGPATYAKAQRLVSTGAVTGITVTDQKASCDIREARTGIVYTVTLEAPIWLVSTNDLVVTCPCGTRPRCVHALALILAVRQQARDAGVGWREQLGALTSEGQSAGTDMGLAFDLSEPQRTALVPLRRDPQGAWTSQRATWKDLASGWGSVTAGLNAQHVAFFRGLAQIARIESGGGQVTLESLGDQAYAQIAHAASAGISLFIDVDATRRLAVTTTCAVPVIDVSQTSAGLRVRPALSIGDQIVDAAHTRIGGESCGWVLSPTRQEIMPVSAQLHGARMSWWRHSTPVVVPADDIADFSMTLAPRLAAEVDLVSTDHTWQPVTAEPLVLIATLSPQGPGVTLTWQAEKDGNRVPIERYSGADAAPLLRDAQGAFSAIDALPPALRVSDVRDVHAPADTLPIFLDQVMPALSAIPRVKTAIDPDVLARVIRDEPQISIAMADQRQRDWFGLKAVVQVAGHEIPLSDIIVALSSGHPYVALDDGTWVYVGQGRLTRLVQAIAGVSDLADSPTGVPRRLSVYQSKAWEELCDVASDVDASARWRERVAAIQQGPGEWTPPVPQQVTLRHYQVEGARWCHWLCEAGLGGILADDMGLGKTLQVLTAIAGDRAENPGRRAVLVVAPTSVASTWVSEVRKFYPQLVIARREATKARRGDDVAEQAAQCDILVTSYHLLRLEADEYAAYPWGGLVLDEAQAVKNPRSKAHQALLEVEAPWRLAVTGTPVENSVMDVWSLYRIVAPGLLPGRTRFVQRFRTPIEVHGDAEALDRLRQRYAPVLCRRTKEQVAADLPEKTEQVVTVDLYDDHRALYDTYLARERQRLLGLLDDVDGNRLSILRGLTMLRLLSLDSALVKGVGEAPSAKTDYLVDQVNELVAAGHSALVFSQFTSYLGRVGERLTQEGIAYAYLDGKTTDRDGQIERFRSGEVSVFLMSIKAGGVGITLTEADYVFLLDPWWNPAVEAQAIDRAHRIGQQRPVTVYRVLSADTIESKVADLAQSKRQLYSALIDASAGAPAWSAEDLRALLVGMGGDD
ncbi:MAG: SNF2-related protein [Actinomycetaceae bacterium]|nr:SNF2-related protein [Actinomycetaceae bacterium]MDU0969578.1 SNF2-related protein [Actinomycetaceae bacterium]